MYLSRITRSYTITMTSLLSSIFSSSSSQLAARIETMKSAEAALISFAHRFKDLNDDHDHDHDHELKYRGSETHELELFDTRIPRSAVPLKAGKKCQLLLLTRNKNDDNQEESHLVIHGIKVTSNIYKQNHSNTEEKESPLVILHGYMNGALYFYRNLLGLSNHSFGGQVYALDMLGWGLSSRPVFETTSMGDARDDTGTYDAEQVYVESLEAWRKEHKIQKMTLGGHSMGGYMATAYAEKYPENVDRLILISPAGVPDDKEIDVKGRMKDASYTFRFVVGAVSKLFNAGVTPAAFLRNLPESRGRKMVHKYIEGRLPAITCPDERKHLGEYLYTNAALPASGEDVLNKILKPTTFAHKPTLHRIPELKVKHVSFIYGQNDWMDPTSGGIESLKKCQEMQKAGIETPDIHVYGVRNAGHLLMLENWQEFNSAMILASGKGKRLSSKSPMPFKVLEPHEGGLFFSQPRWGKKKEEDLKEKKDVNENSAATA
jgi:cardiolipin-specific phospholipase